LAERICQGAGSTGEKVRAIRDYFRNNFQYSLEPVDRPPGTDALNHFLLSGHPAHCEFFASGAVTLLRLQGIPARYATGYRVMQLEEEDGEYWIARNRDAHAWAEAFDEQTQRWIIVEATPGFVDPSEEELAELEAQAGGGEGSGMMFGAENAGAIVQWWRSLPTGVRHASVTMLVLSLGLLVYALLRRSRLSRGPGARFDPRLRQWQRVLRRMDRRLKRRGLVRQPSETLHQFAHRIDVLADGRDAWLTSSARWYAEYAGGRFRPSPGVPPSLPSSHSQDHSG
jgi:hypothetical protein